MIVLLQNEFAVAQMRFEESMRLATEIGDRWMVAVGHHNLGNAGVGLGEHERPETSSFRPCMPTRTSAIPGRWRSW